MVKSKKLRWCEPLSLAQKISTNYSQNWIFLYSGLCDENKNSISTIALFPKEELILESFQELRKKIIDEKKWFGYLSYELNQELEKLPKTKNSAINLPKIHLINFSLIFEFNHKNQELKAHFENEKQLEEVLKYQKSRAQNSEIKIKDIQCNFLQSQYLQAIERIQQDIKNGDFYQVNLTRKIFGEIQDLSSLRGAQSATWQSRELAKSLDHHAKLRFARDDDNFKNNFHLFAKLTQISPANYSSYLKLNNTEIISSSPELFLKIKNNKIISRPIKGTAPRSQNKKEDWQNKQNLKNSAKEKAENLMIVDLVRNDLARICKAGSVKVKNLFKINSYKTLHHMSSEIHGDLEKNKNAIDTIKSCFPAGSMTGAPKIKAMEKINKEEEINRGIYSGAIGYLSKNEANLSVVIRTLIIQKNKFEFQVGGAITHDSNPQKEWQETNHKAKAINSILEINKIS